MKKLSQSRGFLTILLLLDGFELHHVRDSLLVFGMSKAVAAWNVDVRIPKYVFDSEGAFFAYQFQAMGDATFGVNAQHVVTIRHYQRPCMLVVPVIQLEWLADKFFQTMMKKLGSVLLVGELLPDFQRVIVVYHMEVLL